MLKISLLLMLIALQGGLVSCQNGGVSSENSSINNKVTVDGKVVSLVIDATKKVLGNAAIRVTLTNTSQENVKPALNKNGYCYKFTLLDNNGVTVKTVTFGLDKFRKDFGSESLTPGLAYSEYEYVFITDLIQFDGGKVMVEVWLSLDSKPDTIYRVWGEVTLEDILKQLGKVQKISNRSNK
jgi:hypothetical protein